MDKGIIVILQDVAQLINIGRTHILFDREVFKTGLFLKYKETTGNFCSTSVNHVSKSQKDVLTEFSSQVNKFHYDINGHQNTSMDFLCSNFRQINDNVVTVKNDVDRTTNVSYMQKCFKYCSGYKRCYNSPDTLSYESINTSDQVVNTNSSKTSNFDTITNEVPAHNSNDTNENK